MVTCLQLKTLKKLSMINKIQKAINKHFYVKSLTMDTVDVAKFIIGKQIVSIEEVSPRTQVVKTYAKNAKGMIYIASKETLTIPRTRVSFHYTSGVSYDDLVATIVRKFYSQDEENAILRKALAHGNIAEYSDFQDYHNTVETIKTECRKVFN